MKKVTEVPSGSRGGARKEVAPSGWWLSKSIEKVLSARQNAGQKSLSQ